MQFDAGTSSVASAGTAAQINNIERKVKVIEVRARPGNDGDMYFGASDVSSSNGRTLQPGETVKVDFGLGSDTFDQFYYDGDQSGDKMDWVVILR